MMVQFDVKRVQKGTESFMVSFDFTKTPVTQIADYIIIAASNHNSSDIHFDPRDDGMMVRFRIDGDLQDYTFVPKAYEKNLSTRLKLLANMNITESRLPQDGAIKGDFGGQYLDMRVSSLPLNQGEKIVIRILDYTRSLQGVDSLGFHPKNLEKIRRMMGLPNGIILTTGATGSGKSTTTYSILQGLNKPETNVITVEDPIEMNIEGINQVQVNAEIGMTFAAALRSILRQDPNVILIGEIRDSETAQIAVRASITGHLVLSTIHTNNALATVERLLDMDVERYLLSTALSGIISQRLAKMLCPDCRYQRETTKYEKKVFKKFMNMDVARVWDANPKGCEHCRRGYHGRIAVHEVLEIDDDIRAALSNEKLGKKELAKMVYSGSTITMLQDALIKCLEGKTSFEEVYRNIEIENEDDDNYENEIATTIKDSIPKEEEIPESDDLLDAPVKKNTENDISSVVSPPIFTAADFDDSPKEENTEESQSTEATTNNKAAVNVVTHPQQQTQVQSQQQTQVQAQPRVQAPNVNSTVVKIPGGYNNTNNTAAMNVQNPTVNTAAAVQVQQPIAAGPVSVPTSQISKLPTAAVQVQQPVSNIVATTQLQQPAAAANTVQVQQPISAPMTNIPAVSTNAVSPIPVINQTIQTPTANNTVNQQVPMQSNVATVPQQTITAPLNSTVANLPKLGQEQKALVPTVN